MAFETTKLSYGGDMMLFFGTNKTPVAFSTSAKLDLKLSTRDVSSKDSGNWKDKLAGKLEWSASTDALYCESVDITCKTGTATSTLASATFTGVGTKFLTEVNVGDVIYSKLKVLIGTVLSITSDTSLTFTANSAVAITGEPFSVGVHSKTGTITTSLASTTVTGVGTLFTTEVVVGDVLRNSAGATIGVVQSITSNTALVLTANALVAVTGTTYSTAYQNTFNELYIAMVSRTPVAFAFGATKNVVPNFTLETTKKNYTGLAIITGLSANAPDGEQTTYSVTLEGTSTLALA